MKRIISFKTFSKNCMSKDDGECSHDGNKTTGPFMNGKCRERYCPVMNRLKKAESEAKG